MLYDVWLVCWLKISALGRGIYLTYLFELCATNRTEEGDGDWRFLFDVDFNGLFENDKSVKTSFYQKLAPGKIGNF